MLDPSILLISTASLSSGAMRSGLESFESRNKQSQNFVSLALLSAISKYLMNSRLELDDFPSIMLAPMLVAERIS